ncbi:beta-Ig-H3/fasciclin [Gloeothece citriformis PCC 7424]|uniref:Beta-Ig-H3/fasciclin n=1 Tax=Gloeothece citriformis (strain PCC 7424) TaxID=65393 RepID=B7K8S6_GLOC7|nr:fasciclin domain-containing protein [Gloeothece citriformis]ACK71274.1 beta-Ig-H3/fasciclin [Gloeothece citriformis PCC 7424]
MKRQTSLNKIIAFATAIVGLGFLSAVPVSAQTQSEETFRLAQTMNQDDINRGNTNQGDINQDNITPGINQNEMNQGEMNQSDINQGETNQANMNIVQVASNSESFNTLVRAAQEAGLEDTLANQGPYTLFAPTEEAFNELPDGAVDYLLQPENRDLLRQVLTYHVVPGSITANQLSTGTVDALGGGLAVRVTDDRVIVNNASVINPNIQASNGVIHGINRVLMPASLRNQIINAVNAQ